MTKIVLVFLLLSTSIYAGGLSDNERIVINYQMLQSYSDSGIIRTYEYDTAKNLYLLTGEVDFSTHFEKEEYIQVNWHDIFSLREIGFDYQKDEAYVVRNDKKEIVKDFYKALVVATGVSSTLTSFIPAILNNENYFIGLLDRYEFLPFSDFQSSSKSEFKGREIIFYDNEYYFKAVVRSYGKSQERIKVIYYKEYQAEGFQKAKAK